MDRAGGKKLTKAWTAEDRGLYRGFGMAVASLARDHDQPTAAAGIISGYGMRLADFERAELDDFDLRVLRKLFREEGQLRPRSSQRKPLP